MMVARVKNLGINSGIRNIDFKDAMHIDGWRPTPNRSGHKTQQTNPAFILTEDELGELMWEADANIGINGMDEVEYTSVFPVLDDDMVAEFVRGMLKRRHERRFLDHEIIWA